jgi:hypothetical protein
VEVLAKLHKGGLILVWKENLPGEQAVFECVEADCGLSVWCLGSGTLAGVSPVGSNLFITSHNLSYLILRR